MKATTTIRNALAVLLGIFVLAAFGARADDAPVHYTATAVNMNSSHAAQTATMVDIVVNHWTTDAERDQLRTTLLEQGSDHLLTALQKAPKVGYIRTPDSLGYDLHYARLTTLGNGDEHVVLATDRPIQFWEPVSGSRTLNYPFTVIELRLDATGHGEGKMSVATKITADPDTKTIVLENYDTQPVRLLSVQRQGQ